MTLSRTVSSNTPVVAVSVSGKSPKGLVPHIVRTTSTDDETNCVVGDNATSPLDAVCVPVAVGREVRVDGNDRDAISCTSQRHHSSKPKCQKLRAIVAGEKYTGATRTKAKIYSHSTTSSYMKLAQ